MTKSGKPACQKRKSQDAAGRSAPGTKPGEVSIQGIAISAVKR